jgi:DNA-binding response OmpR family regulator
MKFAIADPDPAAAELLSYAAQRRGHQAVCLAAAEKLFDRLPFEPSVIVAAVEATSAADLKIIERIRREFGDAVLFVSMERPREPIPSLALKAGAAEVLRTPYNPLEVVLRAENWAASRGGPAVASDTLKIGDLEIALDRYTATKNGKVLVFTKLELRLVYCLAQHYPHLAPLERLLAFGWDSLGDPDAALIKTHISHIRKKLRDAGGQEFDIVSRQTVGYVLQISEERAAL